MHFINLQPTIKHDTCHYQANFISELHHFPEQHMLQRVLVFKVIKC